MNLEIAYVATTDLIPYANNPRTHSEQQVAQVAASIQEFGFNNPILIDEHNSIIAGHGRLAAAQKLDMNTVPTILLEGLSEAQRKAYVIADNKLTENGGWDYDLLAVEIERLKELDVDIDLTGFDPIELDTILEPEVVEGLTDEDAVPEVPDNPITKRGDVWILGNHRLMCGDSTSIDDVDKLMDGNKVDMVFTDPPYGIDVGNQSQGKGGGLAKKIDYGANNWDKDIPHEAINISITLSDNCVLWGGNYYADKLPPSQCWIVWDKDNGDSDFADVELAWTSYDKASRILKWKWAGMLQQDMKNKEKRVHPTQKPTALAEWTFNKFNCGKNIADLFGGSGSSMIACEKTNRNCYMMELDPKYCDVIVDRWQLFTGKTAQLERPLEVVNG